jgi:hypothetical protein
VEGVLAAGRRIRIRDFVDFENVVDLSPQYFSIEVRFILLLTFEHSLNFISNHQCADPEQRDRRYPHRSFSSGCVWSTVFVIVLSAHIQSIVDEYQRVSIATSIIHPIGQWLTF